MRYVKSFKAVDLICSANAEEDGYSEVHSPFDKKNVISCTVDFDTGDFVFEENGHNVSQDFVQAKFESWDERLASAGK
jgi:hypothetical protein